MPCYNVADTITRAVDSIINQVFCNWELILVDDGSLDETGIICDHYSTKDSRIRVFHKVNGGVSSARQMGFDYSKGDYVIHADPDDWVEPYWLEHLYYMSQKADADITMCNYSEWDGEDKHEIKINPSENACDSLIQLLNNKYGAQLWNKLIKRSLYEANNIRLISGLDLREDSWIVYRLLFFSNKVAHVDEPLYVYNISNQTSITHDLLSQKYQENVYLLERKLRMFRENNKMNVYLAKAFKAEMMATIGYLALNGSYRILRRNIDVFDDLKLSDIKNCPYNFCKPVFYLAILKLYFLIPVYVFFYNKIVLNENS